MLLSEIRTLIRNQADVETDDISDADIDSFVNWRYGLINAHMDWPYLEVGPTDIAVSAGATTFSVGSLDPAFAEFREVRYNPTGGTQNIVRQINPEERPSTNTSIAQGRPYAFWRVGAGTTISLDRPVDAGTVAVTYYRTAPELTGGDAPLFDARFHRLLVIGGMVEVYERSFDHEEAQALEGRFLRGLDAMVNYYTRLRQPVLYGGHAHQPPRVSGRLPWSWE